jgi:hypothetical protein
VLIFLMMKCAGQICGIDAWVEKLTFVTEHPKLRRLFA